MATYVLALTELELACGVTLEDVARELPRGLFIENGAAFMVSRDISPALASSVARCAFSAPVKFSHLSNGYPVYRMDSN